MFRVTIRGLEVTCESTEEIVALVLAAPALIDAVEPTRPTPPRATTGKKQPTAAQKKARAKKAREGYKKKKAAKKRFLTKKAAEDAVKAPLDLTPPPPTPPTTTAETHHGAKEKRADTGGDIISALRRSGLPLTIPEIRDDLQRSGWKYNGPDPKGTIRATLNRLVTKGEVAKGSSNGALTFRIARVEHADPLPHQQRESDV
jgi:hypothetical protein